MDDCCIIKARAIVTSRAGNARKLICGQVHAFVYYDNNITSL